jgi:hypothetical protein
MALADGQGRFLLVGIALGIGAATIGRDFFVPLRHLARPMAKAALRSGLNVVDQGRLLAARAAEQLEDVAAEVEAERNAATSERG